MLAAYTARYPDERAAMEPFVRYVASFDTLALYDRKNFVGHLTAGALIVSRQTGCVLLLKHKQLGKWLQPGGHVEASDASVLDAAFREAREETGILRVSPLSREIAGLDVLTVPGHVKRGKYVPTHLHLSVSYLLSAPEDQPLAVKSDENSGVQWIPISEIESYSSEPEMYPVYRKLVERMRKLP